MTKNLIVSAAPPRRGNACESFVFILLWFMIGFWFLAIATSPLRETPGGQHVLLDLIPCPSPPSSSLRINSEKGVRDCGIFRF